MQAAISVILISLGITCVRSHPRTWSASSLNPVHGLYIKRSSDGATGDLYVAATEDNGVKSQWLVDQPINFLQVASATQPNAAAIPVPYPGFSIPHDDNSPQKRAVTPIQTPSPPVQYAYALPVQSSDGIPAAPYPYAYPIPSSSSDTSAPKCDPSSTVSQYPFQFPFQFFYPQMMSAYTNAMSILKDAGLSEDTASTVMAQASPVWPPSSYAYPMYVMAMPSICTQNQTPTTPSTSTSTSKAAEEETTQV